MWNGTKFYTTTFCFLSLEHVWNILKIPLEKKVHKKEKQKKMDSGRSDQGFSRGYSHFSVQQVEETRRKPNKKIG